IGPRQAGKTTLCTQAFSHLPLVSLEPLDNRQYAHSDPRGFLDEHRQGVILDEAQHVPSLFSYLQEEVDRDPTPGRFIVTGSQHFGLIQDITQSLAGRTGVLTLLSATMDELQRFPKYPTGLMELLWTGGYLRIHDQGIPADLWLGDYVTTYVQRDVRQVLNITDLLAFTDYIKLCAGRASTVLNLSALGGDAGLSHNTARSWLSVLEASFICFRVPAWRPNLRKQIVRAPKLHFFDSGLLCRLLGLTDPGQLRHHPLRGNVFESWVASEVYKLCSQSGSMPRIYHYRDSRGLEVDLVLERPQGLVLVECKSAATVTGDMLRPLQTLASRVQDKLQPAKEPQLVLVYGGNDSFTREGVRVLSWRHLDSYNWW
ncbi:MAG: ATP-binding protein, partial [Deltaproteobacteria bacterium]|nr:ATP-binding protein [Deltaproteobacteria bacterium]